MGVVRPMAGREGRLGAGADATTGDSERRD